MLRTAFLAALAIALGATAASAGTFPVPDENPIATVSIPDTWEPKTYEGGVEATSNDGAVYIAVEQVEAKDIKSAIEEGIKFFVKSGVAIDVDSQKQTETKINGLDAFDLSFAGKDKDGSTNVSLTLVKTNAPGKILMLYYWGSADGEKANARELQKISDSIQATK